MTRIGRTDQHVYDMLPRFIVLAGVDGTGKTTHAMELLSHFRTQGKPCTYVWLRFPHLFSLPLLAYARLVGLTRYVEVDGRRYGYWEFYRSRLMSALFPWAMLLDAAIFAAIRVYLPLMLGFTVICDRFVYDMLVDIMMAVRDNRCDEKPIGRILLNLLPKGAISVLLDLDVKRITERRKDLEGDTSLVARRDLYLQLAARHDLPVVAPLGSIASTKRQILEIIGDRQ